MDSMTEFYLMNLLNSAWNSSRSPKQTPEKMSPEQKAIYDIYYKSLQNPAYQGNAPLVNAISRGVVMGGPPTWHSPKTSTGETGYAGGGDMDWGKYLAGIPGLGSGGGGGATAPPPEPGGNAGTPNPTSPGPGNPGSPDPFRTLPDPGASGNTNLGGAGNFDPSSLISRYGKGAAEIVSGIMSANPVIGLKGAWDLFQAWKNGGDTKGLDVGAIANAVTGSTIAGGKAGSDPSNPSPKPYDPKDPSTWNASPNFGPGSSAVSYWDQDTTRTGNPFASGMSQESGDWSTIQNHPRRVGGIQAV